MAASKLKSRNSNVEQGISNDEVKSLLLFPSAFVIRPARYALKQISVRSAMPMTLTAPVSLQSTSQGRRVFCGSLFNFYTAREEVFA
jgi:hypothetical protein